MKNNRKHIFFVEDDDNDVLLVTRALERAELPHRLFSVEDSHKAINYLAGAAPYENRQEHPLPDLILVDLKLVGSSGFEVLEWLSRRGEIPRPPVVILSSSWVRDDVERAQALGADDYLVKPNGFDDLVKLVRDLDARWLRS